MKGKIITSAVLAAAVTLSGCTSSSVSEENIQTETQSKIEQPETAEQLQSAEESDVGQEEIGGVEQEQSPLTEDTEEQPPLTTDTEEQEPLTNETEEQEEEETPVTGDEEEQEQTAAQEAEEPVTTAYASYIKVTGTGVNIRTGAGTSYAPLGSAEQNTLYANLGQVDGWYKTLYQNQTVYISAKYCEAVEIEASGNELVENVIAEGLKLLGVEYVYGAVRYHDGTGKLYGGFTVTEFDCSSLTQYIFYKGAGVLLQVNTRTQIYQGEHVEKSDLQRGDLMFFTNDSRYYNTGIERVGHVAVYLGDNYILHTSSDYAKIEQLTAKRWNYFLEARRMV